MSEVLLSVIVPVYRVQPFLQACIDAFYIQDVPETSYEVIFVDDGSPDDCGKILDENAPQHSNIKVIHQQNAGVSAARNRGLDLAQGKYVWFVDPDDFIQDHFLEKLFTVLNKPDAPDMVTFGVYEFGDYTSDCELSEEERINKQTLQNNRAPNEQYDATLWRHVYRRALFTENNIRFDPLITVCEDNVVHFLVEGRVQTQEMLPDVGYFYRKRKNSLSSGSAERYYESRVRIASLFIGYYNEGYGNHYIAGYLLSSQLKMALLHIAKMKNPGRRTELARLKDMGLFPLAIDEKDTFYEVKLPETNAANIRYNKAYNSIYTKKGYRTVRRFVLRKRIRTRLHSLLRKK